MTPVGPGCRPGTWSPSVSGDGLVLAVTFSDYAINSLESEASKSIDRRLNISFNVPSGYRQAVDLWD